MAGYWDDEHRLLLPTETASGEDRRWGQQGRRAENQRSRAYQAGMDRRPWAWGDPGRPVERGNPAAGCRPWRPFCRDLYDQGLVDGRSERVAVMRAAETEARQRYEQDRAKELAQLRAARAKRAWKVARFVAPRWTRALRRQRKRWAWR